MLASTDSFALATAGRVRPIAAIPAGMMTVIFPSTSGRNTLSKMGRARKRAVSTSSKQLNHF